MRNYSATFAKNDWAALHIALRMRALIDAASAMDRLKLHRTGLQSARASAMGRVDLSMRYELDRLGEDFLEALPRFCARTGRTIEREAIALTDLRWGRVFEPLFQVEASLARMRIDITGQVERRAFFIESRLAIQSAHEHDPARWLVRWAHESAAAMVMKTGDYNADEALSALK